MIYTYSIDELPNVITSLFSRNCDIHNYNTLGKYSLHVPVSKSESSLKGFVSRIHIYNFMIPNVITNESYACLNCVYNNSDV